MVDYAKYQNLHTIVMLKDVIRKWWRMELSFAARDGSGMESNHGEPLPAQNDFCRLALFCKEGNRRCNESVKVFLDKFKANRKLRQCLTHDCHLGFTVMGAPLYIDGEYEGALFVEGFTRQTPSTKEAEVLKQKIADLNPGATDLDRAVERLPVLSPNEQTKLADLLEFGANEIANFEMQLRKRDTSVELLSQEMSERYKFENIVGKSGPMMEVFRLLEKVCASDSTVLIQGESGTGKELVARAIHYNGPRRDRPFVVQNCSAFNDNLLESALFGHVKGSFTGALRDKKGLFEVADSGTFFLDEVGDMSPALQVKVLRVLQEGTFIPVGGNNPKEVDVRVIAATHKDLGKMVERGEFREDLFYRINVIKVTVPPLRERRDDIPVLIEHFLHKHARPGMKAHALTAEAMALLQEYRWPGNIRELENEMERLLVLGSDQAVIAADLISSRLRDAVAGTIPAMLPLKASSKLHHAVEHLEREMIHQGLTRTSYNKSRLSRELGISRSNLILKIAKYGLEQPGTRPDGDNDDEGEDDAEGVEASEP
jgi:two-component system response regulator HupR/HoxA